MADQNTNVMAKLKSATADLHTEAENRPMQRLLAKGTLPREQYVAYLGQLYWLHRTLEEVTDAAASSHRAFATVVRDDQRRTPELRADLAAHGVKADAVTPQPATEAAMTEVRRFAGDDPVSILGLTYVLEGSNNGSKYIARNLMKSYGLTPGEPGLSYFDPYGDEQMPRWLAFKAAMDAAGFDEAEQKTIVDAAKAMFRMIAEISDEVDRPVATA